MDDETKGWGAPMAVHRLKKLRGMDRWSVLYQNAQIAVEVTMAEVYGAPEIVGLAVRPLGDDGLDGLLGPGGPPTVVTADLLRRAPLRDLKRACLNDSLDPKARSFLTTAAENQGRPGRSPITPDLLGRVAAIYAAAKAAGRPTTKAIADALGVSEKTADKYVRRARDRGILPAPAEKSRGAKR
jgi:hypothetical protein